MTRPFLSGASEPSTGQPYGPAATDGAQGRYPNAVAVGGTIWQLNRRGPLSLALLIYLVGIGPTFYFCFFASLSAVCLWLGIRFQHQPTAVSNDDLLQHMMDGLNFIRKNELYYTFISMTFFNSIFGMSYLILMPVFARDVLNVGSQGFGFLQSAGGLGALCGVLAVAYFSHSVAKAAGHRRRHYFRSIARFLALESYPLLILACALACQPVLHHDDQRDPAGQSAGSIARASDEHLRPTWDLMPVGGLIAGASPICRGPALVVGGALLP
jgi:hypothetical protein